MQTSIGSWDREAERLFWSTTCFDSFWHFVNEAFGVRHNPQGSWLSERLHRPFCDWFQKHAEEWLAGRGGKEQKNLLICVPRDFGKTVLITKAGLLWLHLRNPEISAFIGSVTKDQAIEFLKPIKQVMMGKDEFQRFTWFYGNWYDSSRDWVAERVVHAVRRGTARGEPSFGVWGVETGLTGMHPDVICLDDPITYERMGSHSGWIDVVNQHIASLMPVIKGDGLRIFIGTRYHDGDMIGRAMRVHGCSTISGMHPADTMEREDGVWHLYYMQARDYQGNPTYPEQWPDKRLKEFEREEPARYYAQMMNDPATEELAPLTRAKVDQLWVEKDDVPNNLRISIHVDTAFKYKERQTRGDHTVIQVWGHARDGSGEVYYLEGYSSNTWRVEDFNNKLVIILQSLRSRGKWPYILTDEVELGGKQGTWEMTIQNWCHSAGMPAPRVQLLSRAGKKKLTRIIMAASYWVDGKVKLVKGAPGVEQLIDQMLRIGVSQFDDWADSASDVFDQEVYKPVRLPYADESLALARPYDDKLQDGTVGFISLLRRQSEERRAAAERPMPPID